MWGGGQFALTVIFPIRIVCMSDNEAKISLRVYAGAANNELVGFTDDMLKVKIAAIPAKGKANKELLDFLSQCLGVAKGQLRILRGHTSRNKLIAIKGLTREEVLKKLLPG